MPQGYTRSRPSDGTLASVVDGEDEIQRAAGEPPPPPPGVSVPWREMLQWAAAILVVLWALILLPGVVRDLRESAGVGEEDLTREMPAMPEDPVLTAEVRELLRQGREAEAAGHLVRARSLYFKAQTKQPDCFSCKLRRTVVERLIREDCIEALNAGARYLEEGRWEEAAIHYQKVLGLVPHEKANYHLLARQGLQQARAGAKAAGQPLP